MFRNTFCRLFGAGVVASFAFVACLSDASATSVTEKQLQSPITSPNVFTFTFDSSDLSAPAAGASGILTVHARGDYGAQTSEYLFWDLVGPGTIAGLGGEKLGACVNFTGACALGGITNATTHRVDADFEFTKSYVITPAELTALLQDLVISLTVTQGPHTNSPDVKAPPFVEISLSYCRRRPPPLETPLPGALSMFVAGLGVIGGLGYRQRRKVRARTSA